MSRSLASAARQLRESIQALSFAPPVAHVYQPLDYAWEAHQDYLVRYGKGPKRVVFMGMNPGPFGMMQTGVPFGEVSLVRDWLGIRGTIYSPASEHPSRPIEGWDCPRSEVSGRRLWGLFQERFGNPDAFFREHFVLNYCPLAFLEASGRNFTPDKLPASEAGPLLEACDAHLRQVAKILKPAWFIGVGTFAEARIQKALEGLDLRVGRILHPSPASPAANRGWGEAATRQLVQMGVWTPNHPA